MFCGKVTSMSNCDVELFLLNVPVETLVVKKTLKFKCKTIYYDVIHNTSEEHHEYLQENKM